MRSLAESITKLPQSSCSINHMWLLCVCSTNTNVTEQGFETGICQLPQQTGIFRCERRTSIWKAKKIQHQKYNDQRNYEISSLVYLWTLLIFKVKLSLTLRKPVPCNISNKIFPRSSLCQTLLYLVNIYICLFPCLIFVMMSKLKEMFFTYILSSFIIQTKQMFFQSKNQKNIQ